MVRAAFVSGKPGPHVPPGRRRRKAPPVGTLSTMHQIASDAAFREMYWQGWAAVLGLRKRPRLYRGEP